MTPPSSSPVQTQGIFASLFVLDSWESLHTQDGDVDEQKEEFKGLGDQFNMVIIISTFTASLVIAFLSLARDILLNGNNASGLSQSRPLEVGMLLGFLTTATHLIIIIVAGRAATLSFRIRALGKKPKTLTITDFRLYFYLCEQLHLMATTLFLATVLYVTFFLFSPKLAFPCALYVYTLFGVYVFYRTGFWKASVLVEDVKNVWTFVTKLIPSTIRKWFGKESHTRVRVSTSFSSVVERVRKAGTRKRKTGNQDPAQDVELGSTSLA